MPQLAFTGHPTYRVGGRARGEEGAEGHVAGAAAGRAVALPERGRGFRHGGQEQRRAPRVTRV